MTGQVHASFPWSLSARFKSAYSVACCPRYLLLEDTDTGDVLMPLMYMKQVFKVNYSRKISNLHNRLVEKPAGADFGMHDSAKHLYWLWAFESPQNVKTVVRRELGDMASPTVSLLSTLIPCNKLPPGHQQAPLLVHSMDNSFL